MLRAITALASGQDPLRQIPIKGSGGDRAQAPVGIPEFAYDGNSGTYARFDSSSWQQHSYYFGEHFITHIIVRNHNYEGPILTVKIAGIERSAGGSNQDVRIDVNAKASSIYFSDITGGRNRLYEVSIFGHKNKPAN